MTDVYNWDDYIIEIVQESGGKLVTKGILNDAKLLQFPVSLYGRGDRVGSLSLHVLSSNALTMTAEAMTFLKVYRRGQHMRDFIVGKEDWGIDAKSAYLDEYIKLQIEPLEKVLGFAVCQPATAEGTFSFPAGPADDAIKWAVRHAQGADAYDDPDATSRVLSYLTVDADSSDGAVIDTEAITNGNLLKVLQDWGQYWEVDFRLTLRKTTGREHDLFFETFYPRRGADRTEGNSDGNKPVIFSDVLGNIGSARRYREINNLRNAIVARDTDTVAVDGTSVSTYWRREAVADAEDTVSLERELADKQLRIGREFSYLTHPQQQMFADFEVGDKVTTIHHHLGLVAEDSTIIEARVEIGQDLQERISLVFGDFSRTLPESIVDTASGGNGGSAKPATPPIRYNLRADGGTLVPFSLPYPVLDSEIDVTSDDGSVVITGDAGTNTLDLSVPGALYWSRNDQGDPYLYPTNAGDDVQVGADILLDNDTGYVWANRHYVDTSQYLGQGAGGQLLLAADANVLILRSQAAIYFQASGAANKWIMTDTAVYPNADNGGSFGEETNRASNVYSYAGNFEDDITILNGKGLIDTVTNTPGYVYAGNGTRYVPTDPSTLGLWGGYWKRTGIVLDPTTAGDDVQVGASIFLDNSTGYIDATRFRISATTYLYDNGSNYGVITGSSGSGLAAAATLVVYVKPNEFKPRLDNDVSCGTDPNRWTNVYSYAGDFEGDVTIDTSGKGLVMSNNTKGYILMANGTRYVPHTFGVSDLPDHRHPVNGNTGNGTASGTTSDWTAPASGGYDGDRGWNPVYATDKSTLIGYHKITSHTHTFSDAHTHPVNIQSGAPAAP